MAYSNWGAYIWKNGENITKQAADKGFTYISGDKNGMKMRKLMI